MDKTAANPDSTRRAELDLSACQSAPTSTWPGAVLTILIALCWGFVVGQSGMLSAKWLLIVIAVGCLPLVALAAGSFRKALEFLLILSLSVSFGINLLRAYKPGLPITLTCAVTLALCAAWVVLSFGQPWKVRLFPSLFVPIALITLWSGLSFTVAEKPVLVLAPFAGAVTGFLLFPLAANMSTSRGHLRFLIKCVAIAVALSSLLGIAQSVAGGVLNLQFLGERETEFEQQYASVSLSRVSALFSHPNAFALFLNELLPLVLVSAIAVEGKGLRLLCLGSSALGIMALVLTYSRGGWMALAVSLAIIGIFLARRRYRRVLGISLVRLMVPVVMAGILFLAFLPQVLVRLTQDDRGSAYSRIPLAEIALGIIKEHPLTGVGSGNYQLKAWSRAPEELRTSSVGGTYAAHDMWLYVSAELGIPCALLLAWACLRGAWLGVKAVGSADKHQSLFALGILAAMVGLYLHAMIEDLHVDDATFPIFTLMWGSLAAIAAAAARTRSSPAANAGGQTWR